MSITYLDVLCVVALICMICKIIQEVNLSTLNNVLQMVKLYFKVSLGFSDVVKKMRPAYHHIAIFRKYELCLFTKTRCY